MLKTRLSGRTARLLPSLAWLLALAIAATVAATLIIRLIEPPRVGVSISGTADPHQAAQQIVARSPLAGSSSTDTEATLPVRSTQHYTIVGIATGFGTAPGFALVQAAGGAPVPARVGDEIAPGVVVKTIHATHIEIERHGVRENVMMAPSSSSTPAPAIAPASPDSATLR